MHARAVQSGMVTEPCTPCEWTADASGAVALQRRMVALRLRTAQVSKRVRGISANRLCPQSDTQGRLSEQQRALRDTVAKLVWASPPAAPPVALLCGPVCREPHQTSASVSRLDVVLQARVEESLESNYTCLMCLKVFTDPVACVPCGHTYCRSCVEAAGVEGRRWCQECGGAAVEGTVALANLDKLAGKHAFKLAALRDLEALCHVGEAQ